jgi:hypothetical protein
LGVAYRGVEVGGFGDLAIDPATVDPNIGISFRYMAPSQLLLAIPGYGEGQLALGGGGGTDDRGRTHSLLYRVFGGHAALSLVRRPNGDYLTHSALGSWLGPFSSGQRFPYPVAAFAYGVATAANQVPRNGAGTYEGRIEGSAALSSANEDVLSYYAGTARLNVDFAGRTVSGTIDIDGENANSPRRTYTLTQTVFAGDGSGFQGRLMRDGGQVDGIIDGKFTGPAAEEIIVRWSAPVNIRERSGLVFGVWAAPRLRQ